MDTNRFNRYMVECELWQTLNLKKQPQGFNRYMVECECIKNGGTITDTQVLIDTWWNVNYYQHLLVSKMVEF